MNNTLVYTDTCEGKESFTTINSTMYMKAYHKLRVEEYAARVASILGTKAGEYDKKRNVPEFFLKDMITFDERMIEYYEKYKGKESITHFLDNPEELSELYLFLLSLEDKYSNIITV